MNAHPDADPVKVSARWEEALVRSGHRRTEPRRAILQAITSHGGPFTAEDLAEQLRTSGVGRATVFRTIEVLTELGMLHRLHTAGCHGYAMCPPGHHHHLTCSGCGRVESVEGCGLDEQLDLLARHAGFAIEEHHLELSGRCSNCR